MMMDFIVRAELNGKAPSRPKRTKLILLFNSVSYRAQ